MKPRLVQLMTGLLIAAAALTACRKEVPAPVPKPDEVPRPTTLAWAAAEPWQSITAAARAPSGRA